MKMPLGTRLALAKQRETIRRLQKQLRTEQVLTNALSDLVWKVSDQTPHSIKRVRDALNLKRQLHEGNLETRSAYPTAPDPEWVKKAS